MLAQAEKKGVVRGDPARTREMILRASLKEFAENGFGGARIDAIAKNAQVNKQALYYHFESKDGLYKATIEYGYELVRSADPQENDEHLPPPERLGNLIGEYFDNVEEHQDVVALVAEENRLRGRHLDNGGHVTSINAPFVERVRTIYRAGVEQGSFRADVDPIQLWITIVSICQFYVSNAYTVSHIVKVDILTPTQLAERKKHIIDFVLSALRP